MAQIRIDTNQLDFIIHSISKVTKAGIANEALRELSVLSRTDDWEKVGKDFGDERARKIYAHLKELKIRTENLMYYVEQMKESYESLEYEFDRSGGLFSVGLFFDDLVIAGRKPITWEMSRMIMENNRTRFFISAIMNLFIDRIMGAMLRLPPVIDVDLIEFKSETDLLYGKRKKPEFRIHFPFRPGVIPLPVPRRHIIPVGPINRWTTYVPWKFDGIIESIRDMVTKRYPPCYEPNFEPRIFHSPDILRDGILSDVSAPGLEKIAAGEDISMHDGSDTFKDLLENRMDIKMETENSMTAEKASDLLSQGKSISFIGENFSLFRENGSLFTEGAFNGRSMNVTGIVNGNFEVSIRGQLLRFDPRKAENARMQFYVFSN